MCWLRRAAVAVASGLAMNIHMHPPQLPVTMEIIRTISESGVDLSRVYLSHLDEIADFSYLKRVLDTGVTLWLR